MKHLQLTDELQEAASLYAAGAMPEGERKVYLQHLETDECEVCRTEVRALQSALHALALDLPESSPSPAAKMRLMAQAEVSASMRGMQNRANAAAEGGCRVVAWIHSGLHLPRMGMRKI